MRGGRLAHLNLELGSRRDRVGAATVLQRRNAKSGGFIDRFRRHLNRVPKAGRTRIADRARPKRHGASAYHIRFLFVSIRYGRYSLQLTAAKVFGLDRVMGLLAAHTALKGEEVTVPAAPLVQQIVQ
jgi:hypothetical protein